MEPEDGHKEGGKIGEMGRWGRLGKWGGGKQEAMRTRNNNP